MKIRFIMFLILGTFPLGVCLAQVVASSASSSTEIRPSVINEDIGGNNGGSGDYGYSRKNNGVNEDNQTVNRY